MDKFKKRVQISFNRNAESYDKFGIIQREVSTRMIERLSLIKIQPVNILDLGCGTGFLSEALIKLFPESHIISVDFAEDMLRVCRRKSNKITTVCADIEELPFENNKFDLIISSLTFHWCNDLYRTLLKSYNLLKNNGCLVFSQLPLEDIYLLSFLIFFGHIFSIFIKFRGGKAVATSIGVILGIDGLVGSLVIFTWLIVFILSKTSSISALTAFTLLPGYFYFWTGNDLLILISFLNTFLILLTHRSNIMELISKNR